MLAQVEEELDPRRTFDVFSLHFHGPSHATKRLGRVLRVEAWLSTGCCAQAGGFAGSVCLLDVVDVVQVLFKVQIVVALIDKPSRGTGDAVGMPVVVEIR